MLLSDKHYTAPKHTLGAVSSVFRTHAATSLNCLLVDSAVTNVNLEEFTFYLMVDNPCEKV